MLDEAWLNTVRLARDCGNISSLFPPGITRLWDLPYTLHAAIRMALHFLSFEELKTEERPPKRIWLDDEKMKAWFAQVKADREAEIKGEGWGGVREMPQNELMREVFGDRFN